MEIVLFLFLSTNKKRVTNVTLLLTWQRPTLPHGLPCSTIGAVELNCPVRNGKECFLYAIITKFSLIFRVIL